MTLSNPRCRREPQCDWDGTISEPSLPIALLVYPEYRDLERKAGTAKQSTATAKPAGADCEESRDILAGIGKEHVAVRFCGDQHPDASD